MTRYVAEGDNTGFLPGVYLEEISLVKEPSLPLPEPMTTAQQVIAAALPLVRMAWRERFYVIPLNGRHQPLGLFLVSVETMAAAVVHPPVVFMPCMQTAAVACIVFHNHPSGDATPSAEDRAITDRLRKAGDLLGISVLDHVVIGRERSYSFALAGFVNNPKERR